MESINNIIILRVTDLSKYPLQNGRQNGGIEISCMEYGKDTVKNMVRI